MFQHFRGVALLAAALLWLTPQGLLAEADADETGMTTVVDPNFGAYTAIKTSKFYRDSNPADPFPGDGYNTYIYTLANDSGSQIPLIGFGVQIPGGTGDVVVAAGFISGSGVEPDGTQVLANEVKWAFTNNPINPGSVSAQLYIISAYDPGTADVTINGEFGLDAPATCNIVPIVPPEVVGDPNPCTIGFWKNREEGKKGLLQYFPDGQFEAIKAEAVSISSVFDTEAELVEALTSKGNRTIEERAKQQLAALLLNIAAGTLFPDNTKCRLFLGNEIDTNGDGTADMTVGEALTLIESNILSGDPELQKQAQALADDINNGIGVIGVVIDGS
jgi:hypothetical protein